MCFEHQYGIIALCKCRPCTIYSIGNSTVITENLQWTFNKKHVLTPVTQTLSEMVVTSLGWLCVCTVYFLGKNVTNL